MSSPLMSILVVRLVDIGRGISAGVYNSSHHNATWISLLRFNTLI